LEAEPYWDTSFLPLLTYKASDPFIGKIVSVKKIVGPDATGETYDIVIDHGGKLPYWEGQSLGVIPPGYFYKNKKIYYFVNNIFVKNY
jgi:ferredoxin--NADP+ reductase